MNLGQMLRPGTLIAVLLLGGCVDNGYDYNSETPVFSATSDEYVVVAVLDQRPYVLSGHNLPTFVGLQRIVFGIPSDVATTSGRPLADDIANTIVRGLAANGIDAKATYVFASADASTATDAVIAAGADRGLIVLLHEWKSDTMVNVAMRYNVTALVVDGIGDPIGTASLVSGSADDAGGSFINPVGYATENVPTAAARVLERLLNEPSIVGALE